MRSIACICVTDSAGAMPCPVASPNTISRPWSIECEVEGIAPRQRCRQERAVHVVARHGGHRRRQGARSARRARARALGASSRPRSAPRSSARATARPHTAPPALRPRPRRRNQTRPVRVENLHHADQPSLVVDQRQGQAAARAKARATIDRRVETRVGVTVGHVDHRRSRAQAPTRPAPTAMRTCRISLATSSTSSSVAASCNHTELRCARRTRRAASVTACSIVNRSKGAASARVTARIASMSWRDSASTIVVHSWRRNVAAHSAAASPRLAATVPMLQTGRQNSSPTQVLGAWAIHLNTGSASFGATAKRAMSAVRPTISSSINQKP